MARSVKPAFYKICPDAAPVPVIPGVTHNEAEMIQLANLKSIYPDMVVDATEEMLQEMNWKPLIYPFVSDSVKYMKVAAPIKTAKPQGGHYELPGGLFGWEQRIPSYGVSSYGYDIRLAEKDIKIFSNINSPNMDPMDVGEECYVQAEIRLCPKTGLRYYLQPPNSLALAHTAEIFNISRDMLVGCFGKSTYARVGLVPMITILEPEWSGQLVLELANQTNSPVKVYIDCGIAQLVFWKASEVCRVSYADRGGKYMHQRGTVGAII
ncbi:Deoxycytidine triphosphate deaminase [compost metagenome]